MSYPIHPLAVQQYTGDTPALIQAAIGRLRASMMRPGSLWDRTRRVVTIELAGMPRTGKTTTQNLLATLLNAAGLVVVAPPESATFPDRRIFRDDLFVFNTLNACDALYRLVTAQSFNAPNAYGVLILDRGLADYTIWLNLLRSVGRVSAEEFDAAMKFFTLPRWIGLTDLAAVFHAPSLEVSKRNAVLPELAHFKTTFPYLEALERTCRSPQTFIPVSNAGASVFAVDSGAIPYSDLWKVALAILDRLSASTTDG